MGREPEHYTAGTQRLIIEYRSWKIMPLICYDLRFPFWCRNAWQGDAALFDLQIFIANWPAVRSSAWKKLLPARAIENVAYVAGLNRVGEDGHGMAHSGDSMVIDYMGEIISAARPFEEEIMEAQLSKEELLAFREKFPVLKDASAPIREERFP
jgi:predicted amidohydrolase